MNLNILIIILISIIITGCASPTRYSHNDSGLCQYDEIASTEFKISNGYAPSLFFFDGHHATSGHLEISNYASIESNPFKIVKTGLSISEIRELKFQGYERKIEEEINGEYFYRDGSEASMVVTKDCFVFYMDGRRSSDYMRRYIVKAGGGSINSKDLLEIYGPNTITKINMNPTVSQDEFDKTYTVKTPYINNTMIRAGVSKDKRTIKYAQVYANLTFKDEWGFIKYSKDMNGKNHKITKISTNTDCKGGCKLTETIGIDVDDSFLRKNKKGFKIKVYGTKSMVVEVPAEMVRSYLTGIDMIKK
jgi:hypothetical protein